MKNVLVISGHTDLNDSVANKTILEELEKKVDGIEVSYLDKLYPDYKIDVEKEQEKLLKADIIVLQYPMFWYAMPSLLQCYLEKVFAFGFSHGHGKQELKGKKIVVSLTSGAGEENYNTLSGAMFDIEDYLVPIKTAAAMCGMTYCGYIYTGGVSFAFRNEEGKVEQMKLISKDHAARLIKLLEDI